jgi:hypothetical protein
MSFQGLRPASKSDEFSGSTSIVSEIPSCEDLFTVEKCFHLSEHQSAIRHLYLTLFLTRELPATARPTRRTRPRVKTTLKRAARG